MLSVVVFGFLFGAILQYSRLNRYNTISGMSMLKDLTMAKAIAVAIGLGIVFVNISVALGYSSYHIKPLLLGGVIIGGIIFGSGMSILGYCPGTIPVSMGEGSIDAFIGFFGGLAGGIVYTLLSSPVKLLTGPNLGNPSLAGTFDHPSAAFLVTIIFIGLIIVAIAFYLNRLENSRDRKWLYAGTALAILTAVIFLKDVFDRVLGASGFYPYLGSLFTGLSDTEYIAGLAASGRWEMYFLAGAFLSGLVLSIIRRDFSLTLIHSNWRKHRDNSISGRVLWAFVGGFLLIFGARMAGGCTSGHIISGGVQLAASSWLFAVFVFGSFLLTGRLFYKKTAIL